MISENVTGLVDGAYKIKPNQDKNLTNDQNFVEGTQDDSLGKILKPFGHTIGNCHYSRKPGNTRVFFNQTQTPKRQLKPVVDELLETRNQRSGEKFLFKGKYWL